MKLTYRNFLKWLPSILRGGLWITIQVLAALTAALSQMTDDQFANMSERMSWLFWASLLSAGFVAWRTYIDSSHATQKQKVEQTNERPSYVAMAGSGQPVP